MAIYDYLPKYPYIEANNLKGLQPGFVVSQMEVAAADLNALTAKGVTGSMLPNGVICSISVDGVCEWASGKPMFIVYNEPLNTIHDADEFYATKLANENPRLVKLIPGDEWMASGTVADHVGLQAAITAGLVAVVTGTSGMSNDDWFDNATMPNGDAGIHLVYLGQ